ncbi:hypothetical protein ABK040_004843 [Willaertia magna]
MSLNKYSPLLTQYKNKKTLNFINHTKQRIKTNKNQLFINNYATISNKNNLMRIGNNNNNNMALQECFYSTSQLLINNNQEHFHTFHFEINSDLHILPHYQETVYHDYIILLNTPFLNKDVYSTFFKKLWFSSEWKCCADGGANRLLDFTKEHKKEEELIPDIICGDLDSLKLNVKEYYELKGTEIKRIKEQDSNDLQKCVRILKERIKNSTHSLNNNNEVHRIFIVGGGGRLDQEMCNLNTLYIEALQRVENKKESLITNNKVEAMIKATGPIETNLNFQFIQLTPYSLSYVLLPGKHLIVRNENWEKKICALVPLGIPCRTVTTNGLKWNLKEQRLEFGGLVSTSNEMIGEEVWIENSDPLLWITTLNFNNND